MLGQRVLTALVLAALVLMALAAPGPMPFFIVAAAATGAAGWEWSRLNGFGRTAFAAGSGVGLALVCLAMSQMAGDAGRSPALWWSATVAWIVGGGVVLGRGVPGWSRLAKPLRWALGLGLLMVAWLALAKARVVGVNFMLSTLCVVWMADIAAYFGGRAFGRRKLAPSISPGKSWAGVWSGMLGVQLLALAWIGIDMHASLDSPSVFSALRDRLGWPGMAAALVTLCGLSVVGDLFESLVKRAAGAKDSSQLLPGHGGVLDRLDALLPVLPAAMALAGG